MAYYINKHIHWAPTIYKTVRDLRKIATIY